ncbi:MAG: hypothetical protein QNJ46_03850 [Leptolyngbyaceae cyanobacterium MO_188.B28]|nr:hypothetical protein [Leptolyngbyaceae cyanobacterium MO_188.B28]
MKTSRNLLLSFISLGFLLGASASPALSAQTPQSVSDQSPEFLSIEKPLLRIGLSFGGIGMIGILISSAIDTQAGSSLE